ncbi:MAG: division/cell wall cluster transcriptional repressor MraZ [Syntrophothermus sp.]
MTSLHGEFECRIDDKGRIILPMGLKKQISPEAQDHFMVNRGFEGCLNLFPMNEWKTESERVNHLNLYNQENRVFLRNFYRGATELALDGSNRILLPKSLLEYAKIDKDVILTAFSNRIEIWSKEEYERHLDISAEDYARLAEKVMGDPPKTSYPDGIS